MGKTRFNGTDSKAAARKRAGVAALRRAPLIGWEAHFLFVRRGPLHPRREGYATETGFTFQTCSQ